jgi:hypothetical protein
MQYSGEVGRTQRHLEKWSESPPNHFFQETRNLGPNPGEFIDKVQCVAILQVEHSDSLDDIICVG